MLNLAIDRKLRGCDAVAIEVEDVSPRAAVRPIAQRSNSGKPGNRSDLN
jgi:hypothetical protein